MLFHIMIVEKQDNTLVENEKSKDVTLVCNMLLFLPV